jgi:hypothetical protein
LLELSLFTYLNLLCRRFIECKNISEVIGSEVVKKLAGSVPPNGIGVVVTTNKLSSDAEREMRTQISLNSARNLRMAFLDRTDLEQIAKGEKRPIDSIIERYYYVLAL